MTIDPQKAKHINLHGVTSLISVERRSKNPIHDEVIKLQPGINSIAITHVSADVLDTSFIIFYAPLA